MRGCREGGRVRTRREQRRTGLVWGAAVARRAVAIRINAVLVRDERLYSRDLKSPVSIIGI